ncbi:DNA integrity scanning protein DisA nucleotide-binding domain protein (plasmid) [Cytobacillus oceanisediminis]|uniref:sporulation-specific diadenylate cyclase CdaS n=1 Tax=Cytobacillus oceanisediminis TaxID=665099 RepID=UPI0018644516|nr:sporulation-specific diadenylate cyclase CdaS [Cytobacillus oceanisediminis]QOK29934.1 DNA integrity scanning protein DisA nucleotide-binding domain protein [Cytobacillus oceanisediminis]
MEQNFNQFDLTPIKRQMKEDLKQLVTRMENCLKDLDDENYCLLKKFEDIREGFAKSEANATSFYLKYYLAPFTDKYVDISTTIQNLSKHQQGALIVVERKVPLEDSLVQSGTPIGATLTSFLLESIFIPGSPLHDGAVLIRGSQIVSAANILPIPTSITSVEKLGTRHRAALGLTMLSDALVLVVSEETGKASFALDGKLYPITGLM